MNILDENIPKPQRELLLPIPEGSDSDKETIGALAKLCNALGQRRYDFIEIEF